MPDTMAGTPTTLSAPTSVAELERQRQASINRLLNDRPVGWFARLKFQFIRRLLADWTRLFGLTGLYWLGSVFATAELLISFKRRSRIRRSLARVFPNGIAPARELRIVRRHFRRTRCDKLFYLTYDRLPRNKIMGRVRCHGREHLDAGLARGNGVYVAMSHHGSHHIMGMLLSLLGYHITGIRDRNEGALRSYMQQAAGRFVPEFNRIQMLYADDFPREIFRCFRENRLVVSALDIGRSRGLKLKTCPVKIFGQSREFLTGTMQIAMRCEATIIPAFLVSRANFYYRVVFLPPLYIPGQAASNGADCSLPTLMQNYASGIEQYVRKYPDHLSKY